MATIDDLTTPLTPAEIRSAIYATIAATGTTTTNWKPGAIVRTLIAGVAIVLSALSRLVALIARSGFLELAEGAWLTLVARYVYGVERIEASYASGVVLVSNSSGGSYILDPGDLVVRNTVTSKTYANTVTVTIGSLAASVPVAVAAVEAGAASTALPGEVGDFEVVIVGLSVTNPTALVGADAEEDPVLRLRCTEKLGSLSPMGPPDAYGYAARNAKRLDGTPIGVTRVRIVKDGMGGVDVYVATASGAVPGDAADPATDLGAINEAIQRNAASLCDTARIHTATAVVVPVSYTAWVANGGGLTNAQIAEAIGTELTAYMAALPIGGYVTDGAGGNVYVEALSAIVGRARTIDGVLVGVTRPRVTLPVADTVLGNSSVAVLGTVTATINSIPQSGIG